MARDFMLDQPHSLQGMWWLADRPGDQVAGTLTYDAQTGARLALIGVFGDLTDTVGRMGRDSPYVTIHGFSTDGREITLLRAIQAGSQLSMPGMATEAYVALWALIGGHFRSMDDDVFTASEVRFDGLAEWLARQPFSHELKQKPRRIIITVEPPKDWVLGTIDAGHAEVVASMVMNTNEDRLHRTEVVASNRIGIRPDGPRSLDWHVEQLGRINRLTALCTGRHLPFRHLRLIAGETEIQPGVRRRNEVDILVHLSAGDGGRPSADPPIYSAAELIRANPDGIAKWFDVSDAVQPVIDLFFTVLSDRTLPTEVAFLLTIQAIEVHHRRTAETGLMDSEAYDRLKAALLESIPSDAPKDIRDKLAGALTYANEPSLGQRLRRVAQRLKPAFGKAPLGFDPAKIQAAVNSRNYYTHYSPDLADKALSGVELHRLTDQFRPLLFALLLAELDLPLDDIQLHLTRRGDLAPR